MSTHRTPYFVLIGLVFLVSLLVASCSNKPRTEQTSDSLPGAIAADPASAQKAQSVDTANPSPSNSTQEQPLEQQHDSDGAANQAMPGDSAPGTGQARIGELIERGRDLLHTQVAAVLDEGNFTPEWCFEDEIARLDEGAFPDWARSHFEICMYWELPMTDELIRIQRQPGESRWFELKGVCWGWILLGENGHHVLELAHEWPEAIDKTESFAGARGVFRHVYDWGQY